MTPADKVTAAEVRRRFAGEVSRPDAEVDLGRAALLLGAEEEPRRADVGRCLARLDEMGEEARARAVRRGGSRVEALNGYLFEELGFVGNESDYYDPRNSMLHQVLGRRKGIPITLSVVYIEVGRRAGLRVEGVGLPGHFVVRAFEGEDDEGVLVDPFNRRSTDPEECQGRIDLIYDGRIELGEEHLRAVGARSILARMLGNLKAVYARAGRDRGMLLAQLGRLHEAVADTQTYLNLSPDAPDADAVREQLKKMQARQAMLN
jgi:regulator of sirC expression with transglutaminase-like and TPR domain